MLKNENIICISSIDWDFMWQGHQEIMATFAKNGNRVLFIENTGVRVPGVRDLPRIRNRIRNWLKGLKGIRQEMDNLYVFSPLILPFPYSRIARWINRHLILSVLERWIKVTGFNDPIVWTFLPTGLALDLINSIDKKLVIYYCIADFAKLVKRPEKVIASERKVIQKADLIFAQGEKLKRHCEKYNSNVSIFPFGVNLDVFESSKRYSPDEIPTDINKINGRIVGYIGGIHRHIDFKLIKFVAQRNPDWTLLFIGPVQTEVLEIKSLPNVVFLEKKQHKELVKYAGRFDVCLIPYLRSEYTETVYPTKLNEYLAIGKAVVSTPLPEMVTFNNRHNDVIYIGKDKEEFEGQIKKALAEDTETLRSRRIEVAKENSWIKRIEEISELIKIESEKKKLDKEARWKENLLVFYRKARKKAIKIAAACFLLYLLFFKTSLMWFVAGPLKISQVPQKADAIVVFGGGVGETGSPGKSTIERARYAAELYNKGYASKIIFSSGYFYIYNDAENMKLIALSMGVPKRNIILEQRANSTYENVIFSKEILDKNKWNSILLVSSPYHMRRARLVFNKWKNNLEVTYTPVKICQFYYRPEGLKLSQIKAIAHEYLGIAYYWFKGYI